MQISKERYDLLCDRSKALTDLESEINRLRTENRRLLNLIAMSVEDDAEGPHFFGKTLWTALNDAVSGRRNG